VPLPKKEKPFIAKATSVPSIEAITIAPVATRTELRSASLIG
jgi:hypothetical protein